MKTDSVVTPEVKAEPETKTENVSKQEPQQEEHRIAVEGDAEYELYDEMHKMAEKHNLQSYYEQILENPQQQKN